MLIVGSELSLLCFFCHSLLRALKDREKLICLSFCFLLLSFLFCVKYSFFCDDVMDSYK